MARIDGLNLGGPHLDPAGGTTSTAQPGSAGSSGQAAGARSSHDVLSLSPRVRVIAEAARAVADARDVRAEKVAALKAAIASGTYTSNAREIAARLLADGIAGDLA